MTTQQNKRALIVGGSSGMGLATATRLAKDGTDLIVIGRDERKLAEAREAIAEVADVVVETVAVDLYDAAAVDAFTAKVATDQRPIDQLVNAAGTLLAQALPRARQGGLRPLP